MGKTKIRTKKKRNSDESDSEPSSSPSSYTSDDERRRYSKRRRRSHSQSRRRRNDSDDSDSDEVVERRSSRREKDRGKSRRRKDRRKRDRGERKRRKSRKSDTDYDDDDDSESGSSDNDEEDFSEAKKLVADLLQDFPGVANDLKLLLEMIDDGQAVDIKGISEKALMKHLKKLFLSLNLKEKGDRVFLLRSKVRPTLEVIGPLIASPVEGTEQDKGETLPAQADDEAVDNTPSATVGPTTETAPPRRRFMGPEMPSAELLAAAAKLTEAEAELREREAELQQADMDFIGPPPPAIVAEAASSNEAERFEEVTRIMGIESDSPYDIVGVNHNMAAGNIKKRFWKLSLMVHPDKCSHPQAHQAFIKLKQAVKDLEDPQKRKVLDEKIKKKEEEEKMKAEMRSMREAALWRRSQGLSMEGDDLLLAELEVKEPPKRDEWMTTLPRERKPGGMPMHSTSFHRTGKEGRGDTSAWTDSPVDRAHKAKTSYLEAYNAAAALASNEEYKLSSADAALVDEYNKAKRSKSLVQKHKEEGQKSRSIKISKKAEKAQLPKEDEEWVGNHPWKPWDREKDLTAGRQKVKLDADDMQQGLTSRFSSGSFQRSFL